MESFSWLAQYWFILLLFISFCYYFYIHSCRVIVIVCGKKEREIEKYYWRNLKKNEVIFSVVRFSRNFISKSKGSENER